jgi:hypothetical protein
MQPSPWHIELQWQRRRDGVVFFTGVHLALKGWLGRKLSAQVLVGLQVMGSGHLALALPTQGQLALWLPNPCTGQTEHHMVHGRPYPCTGQTRASPDAWVLAKGPIGYEGPNTLWCLGGSNARGRPQRYLALGSWQKAWLPMTTPSWVRTCPRPTPSWVLEIIIQSVHIKNIIICIINIITFIITQSIDIKNIIICVVIIIEILNIII